MSILVKFLKHISILVQIYKNGFRFFFENFEKCRFYSNFWKFSIISRLSEILKYGEFFEKFRFWSKIFKKFRFKWNFRKKLDLGEIFEKNLDLGEIFWKISILVMFWKKVRFLVEINEKCGFISILSNFRKSVDLGHIWRQFRKMSIWVKFSKNFDFVEILTKKWRDFGRKFSKNLDYWSKISKNVDCWSNFGFFREKFRKNYEFGQNWRKFLK